MPIEVKETVRTKEERDLGIKLLDKYRREQNILFDEYCQMHAEFLKIRGEQGVEVYEKLRRPVWNKYKEESKKLYDDFVADAEVLGYSLGDN